MLLHLLFSSFISLTIHPCYSWNILPPSFQYSRSLSISPSQLSYHSSPSFYSSLPTIPPFHLSTIASPPSSSSLHSLHSMFIQCLYQSPSLSTTSSPTFSSSTPSLPSSSHVQRTVPTERFSQSNTNPSPQ